MLRYRLALASAVLLLASAATRADEGMWTYQNFPSATVEQKYGAHITPAWLDHVRTSTVRLSGCTASFVSREGLIATNHHCSVECLDQNSSRSSSLLETGFLARKREDEIRCKTQVADVLVGAEDITAKVSAAVAGLDEKTSNEVRKRTLTELEGACEKASRAKGPGKDNGTGPLKCESVELYQGGQYWLYKYKRYDDVRLVFAPEQSVGFFGGDVDNFQFPRWDLDMSVLRAYENGKPAVTPSFLQFDWSGADPGELVFVSGHPGSTDRLLTVSQLHSQRDFGLPQWLLRASELRGRYLQFAREGAEQARLVNEATFGLENSIKVRRKELDALLDDALMERKAKEEAELKARVAADPKLAAGIGDPWSDIARAQVVWREIYLPYSYLEAQAGFNSTLIRQARTLVRAAAERAKPDGERLREYRETALPRIEQRLKANVPIYPEVEELTLSFSLERMREWLGPDHPVVKKLLSKDSPDTLAKRLVAGTKLADPKVRMALWTGGQAAIDASDDPMIQIAKLVDADARAVRKRYEDEVEAVEQRGQDRIARARFAVYGTSMYPDATFTLRLNYGTVQGWQENGRQIEPYTLLGGIFDRATGKAPFALPESWLKAKPRLDLSTRFDMSTNNDIVGGNSGSPLVDAQGRIVGLMFDGNIHSISGSYWFDAAKNRAIAVHAAVIREALSKIYGADALLDELSGTAVRQPNVKLPAKPAPATTR